jgi:DNA-binding NtrC family response regulator
MDHRAILATRGRESSVRIAGCHCSANSRTWIAAHPAVNATPRKSIVLLDDEKSYVDLLSAMLAENLAVPVHTFTRPLDALAALPGLDPGVVVTDYYMPQLNGFEFIAQAAPKLPGVPFILITGHAVALAQEDLTPIKPLKAVLAKPFGWRTLADEILRHWPEAGGRTPAVAVYPTSL